MTNEQQVIQLMHFKVLLLRAIAEGQNTLADEYPETIGFFRPVRTKAFKPFKEMVKGLDEQIAILCPSFS